MLYSEPKSFSLHEFGPAERAMLRAARNAGRVVASLTDDGPSASNGLARYAILETLCSKGLLAYDGDGGMSDELELGFVLTDAGQTFLSENSL